MNRFLLFALFTLLSAAAVQAQFEIKGGSTNLLDPRRAGASATLSGGGVNAITVRGGGKGYLSAPSVTLSAPPSGTTATAVAVLTGDVVTSITVTLAGSGYVIPPVVTITPPATPSGSPVTTRQYAGVANTSAASGPINQPTVATAIPAVTAGRYPRARDMTIPGSPVVTIVLMRTSFGHSFASGSPLYLLGDEIQRPRVSWNGAQVDQNYWRAQPVQPGETFSPQGTSNLGALTNPPYAMESVLVTNSSISSKTVTVSSPPPTLISGATLLGSLVATVNGNTVTLMGNANQTISSATVPFTPYQPYYYSPHANKVFATQSGRVTITWVSAVPDTSDSVGDGGTPKYKFRRETFAVSSGTTRPVRTMFWTEKGFDAQPVSIPAGRIVRVNPVYNTFLPSTVVNEYTPVGNNPGQGLPPENRTVWYDNQLGPPTLHAYNAEGRIFVEYLGPENQGTSGVHQFVGADIVEVKRVAEVETLTAKLGTELVPRAVAESGDDQLVPKLVFSTVIGQKNPYGDHQRPDGVSRYFAERESLDPDRVTLYWLEASDAAIHFLTAPSAPLLSIQWPKLKRNYIFVWPETISEFEPVNVLDTGNTVATALQFAATNLPQVIYQDDPAETETQMDPASQRLLVNFTVSADKTNRSLLKFTSVHGPWYVRLFIQSESVLGSPFVPEVPDPDGSGPLIGTPAISAVYTLNDQNADGIADYSPTGSTVTAATVGTRLEPPNPAFELGGYITEGRCYSAAAYIDPFANSVPAAASGGIIPVNARPGDNSLTVWWFKKIEPPTDKFQPFYVPAVAARYVVSYPAVPQDLVIASGKGIENPGLTPEQADGSIYVQNDSTQIGFNPNEEHALMLTGNAYALRTDLNNVATTSQPYVLIAYTEAATATTPARPAMRVARVVASGDAWTTVALDTTGSVGSSTSLAVIGGKVGIGYYDTTNTDYKFGILPAVHPTAAFTPYIADAVSSNGGTNTSLIQTSTGRPAMAYTSHTPLGIKYSVAPNADGSGTWTTVDVTSANGFVMPSSLVIIGGVPCLSYSTGSNALGLAVAPNANGIGTWTLRTADPSTAGGRKISSLAEVAGRPAIAYRENTSGPLKYAIAPNADGSGSWTLVNAVSTSLPQSELSLAVVDGFPAISYHDATNGDLKYIRATNATGTTWGTAITLDSTGDVGRYNSLAIVGGLPAISYYDVTNGNLKYIRATDVTGTVWGPPLTLDSTGNVGQYTALTVISGNPAISYHDVTNGDLKLAYASTASGYTTYPLSYNKAAGTPLQPPMPLTVLPLPLKADKTVRNTEVAATDNATGSSAPASYNSFTYEDRKGQHWLYRGPHVPAANPSFGMKFYYYSRDGFFVPDQTVQPAIGTIMPFIATTGHKVTGDAETITYFPKWPDDPVFGAQAAVLGVLNTAETLALQKLGLPAVRGRSSAQVLYQQSIANDVPNGGTNVASVTLHDPTRQKTYNLSDSTLPKIPASVLTSDYAGRTYFQKLPPHLQNRFFLDPNLGTKGALVLEGEFVDEISGEDYFNLNALTAADVTELKDLCPSSDTTNRTLWNTAIDGLATKLQTFSPAEKVAGSTAALGTFVPDSSKDSRTIGKSDLADITDPDTAVDSYALSSTGGGTGYVTLLFEDGEAFTHEGDPVTLQIIKVSPTLYRGDLKVLLSSNPLDEQVTLRHSGDYGAKPENFEFQWRYAFPNNGAPPAAPVSDVDPAWFTPNGTLGSSIKVGGSPTAALSTPAVIMADTYFTMKYRKGSTGAWSDWMPPKLVEGWIKRVLARITPFNQRMTDLFNNAVNTDVSLLTQAGTRWEGDIALNLNNINEAGLIEIYETVLNRGKSFTIGSGIDFSASNDALLLAAGYLNDLYTILGNEAYADGANPTISIDDQTTVTEVNTSRFSFEGQVASSLDEELALLRGRDNFASPGTGTAPAYNRLFWNYTRGINSGEVLYAVNYNIKEKTGSPTENGILDAADAYRMFPQGHGDAYGHYLTALTGYYKLLTHPDFTWTPRPEAVTVLGQAILIDYQDERKFAAAAGNLARTAQQVVGLVHRQVYKDDPALGWSHFRDSATKPNSSPPEKRDWGLDEWASRSAQGSFFHWVTGNALLLDEDTAHEGVQKIDRTTVPELNELVSAADSFQTTMDNANAHLNPLGLSPGAIAFDISPAELQSGHSHFEQIYDRALRAVLNAKGSFDQAAKMTRLLRNQENQISSQNTAIVDQEYAYVSQLKEIYGQPYAGDVGPGKTFAQDYDGPDIINWAVIDRPTGMVDTTKPVKVTLRVPTDITSLRLETIQIALTDLENDHFTTLIKTYYNSGTKQETFDIIPNQFAQFADVVNKTGTRPQTGELQKALMEAHVAQLALLEANKDLQTLQLRFDREAHILRELVFNHQEQIRLQGNATANIATTEAAAAVLEALGFALEWYGEASRDVAEAISKAPPGVLGLASDATSIARSATSAAGVTAKASFIIGALAARSAGGLLNATVTGLGLELEGTLLDLGFKQEELQAAYEFELLYRDLVAQHYRFADLATTFQTANQQVSNLLVRGQKLLLERESYRQRAAAVISGYRTRDLTFRTFRNEALEQYRTLFDLASRYTYLSAKSYDYETGLLDTTQGKAVIASIVSSRSLGDLTGNTPQATTSTLGDAGLAGSLARMSADFSVAEGRLGINNPDQYGTLFSLRSELYRISTDAATTADDDAWQQSLEQAVKPSLLSDPDVARYCNNLRKPDGSPVAGLIIPFSSTIQHGRNYFGLPSAPGDHNYSPSSYSTKINSVGVVFKGYIGMDPFASGTPNAGGPATNDPNALNATPYCYLIPCGTDYMLAPPLGDTNTVRSWTVHDQALPLPYNLGASSFNTTNFFTATGTLSEQPWILRKHQAFRPVSDPAFFYSSVPAEFTNSRLIGRSVWNGQWKIVIPAYSLLNNEQEGLNRFVRSVKDVQLFLRTYSHSGN